MEIKEYGTTPLAEARLPEEENVLPEAESGINVGLYQLSHCGKADSEILFGEVTVNQLKKVFQSAANFIDYTKFENGEDWGK